MKFEYNGIYATVVESDIRHMHDIESGWGRGYVIIPRSHPFFGKSYNDIEYLNVHGGITLSESSESFRLKEFGKIEGWILGFDTAHLNDTIDSCSELYVIHEVIDFAIKLYECQLEAEK